MPKSRRDFVKAAAGWGLAAGAVSAKTTGEIPRRKLGKTGMEVSIVGLGGARSGNLMDHRQALETIRRCYDLGVNSYMTKPVRMERFMRAIQDLEHYWFNLVVLPEGATR